MTTTSIPVKSNKKSSKATVKTSNIDKSNAPTIDSTPSAQPVVKIKNLTEKALLIELSIGKFSGNKKDARVTTQVAKDEHAKEEYVKVTKSLMRSEETKKVQNIEQKLRALFYKLTRPWGDSVGIVKAINYIPAKLELEAVAREYMTAVDELVAAYDNLVQQDRLKLGNMFNDADYPSKDSFRARFYVNINVKQVEKSDFRSGALSQEEAENINKQIEARVEESVKIAQHENLSLIKEKFKHLVDRLTDKDAKFHKSAVTNTIEVIEAARKLNIDDDTNLESLYNELEKTVNLIDPETVRDDEATREASKDAGEEALAKIEETMKGFGF